MNKFKSSMEYFKLSLIFALCVFLIILATLFLSFSGTILLVNAGVIDKADFRRFPLLTFCLASIVIGTLLAFLSSRVPLHPLHELMKAADRIADGDYSVRVNLKGPEMLRTLGNKFNHMTEEIGSVEMLRTDFINNFSHEFKTPIVSIRGFAKALKWDDLTDSEREEYLDIIITESERLSSLSTNVLYLSKLEQQTILTGQKRFNLSEQIRLVFVLLDKKFADKNIEVIFDSGEYYVTGNEEMLKQVWINLIDNAVKFSPVNGRIEVNISETDTMLDIGITNQGSIPPEIQAHIFDKFFQGDRSRSTVGNGLGLAIVKKIVELHSGSIQVYSDNGISTFEIMFLKK